jgi:hypothetical protein
MHTRHHRPAPAYPPPLSRARWLLAGAIAVMVLTMVGGAFLLLIMATRGG